MAGRLSGHTDVGPGVGEPWRHCGASAGWLCEPGGWAHGLLAALPRWDPHMGSALGLRGHPGSWPPPCLLPVRQAGVCLGAVCPCG